MTMERDEQIPTAADVRASLAHLERILDDGNRPAKERADAAAALLRSDRALAAFFDRLDAEAARLRGEATAGDGNDSAGTASGGDSATA